MPFVLNDRVEVRAATAHAWRAGEVTDANAGAGGGCYEVTLDNPVTGNAWSGVTRKRAGAEFLKDNRVYISKHVEDLDPLNQIKAEGT
jgi:hypothetical protein